MPSLILTGYPSSGKTTVAKVLKERALQIPSIQDVVIINEESVCPDWTKQGCYATSLEEKKTRAALKSSFDRAVATANKRTLVVLDSLNYIKGFRYELHCLSKAAGERHGTLWVLNRAAVVEEWNQRRPPGTKEREVYSSELLLELIKRYEAPDERNRWDKPLYTVDIAPPGTEDSKSEVLKKSIYNMHALGDSLAAASSTQVSNPTNPSVSATSAASQVKKPSRSAFSRTKKKGKTPTAVSRDVISAEPPNAQTTAATSHESPSTPNNTQNSEIQTQVAPKPVEEQLDDILNAFLASKELKQGTSTQQHIAVSTNVLSEMDSITTRLVSAICTAQTAHTGGKLQVSFGRNTHLIDCPRMMALPELRRLRRQYLQWVSTHPPDDTSEKGISVSFLKFLEEQL